ncbi:MAG TPA: universal stress protein [Candidatus Acidoferrum sp.]|jgi:nucleotide-binding universal stress UspA family protein
MFSDSVTGRSDQNRPGGPFRRILAATDFSQTAGLALGYAHALAMQFQAKLYLVHVVPKEMYFAPPESSSDTIAKAKQYAQQELQKLAYAAGLSDVAHQEILGEGSVWPALQNIIETEQIEVVVVGTHGRTSNKKYALGSVAEEIFRMADCAVLTVGRQAKVAKGATAEFRELLYATNFKPHAERASSAAYFLEREHAAHLSVLHVVEDANEGSPVGNTILRDFLLKRMRKTMPAACLNRCEPDFLIRFGEPGQEILQTATECGANLIVLGLRNAKKSAGYLPSAVAYRIACQAPCPVLTLRR